MSEKLHSSYRNEPDDFGRMTEEQIKAAEQVSIVDYCQANGIPVKHDSGNDWRMVEYDSVVITDHLWHRKSEKPCPYTNFTGGSATQFLQAFEGLNYREAVFKLLEFIDSPLLPENYRASIKGKIFRRQQAEKWIRERFKDRPGKAPAASKGPQAPAPSSPIPSPAGGQAQKAAKPKKPFKLPEKNDHDRNVFAYLTKTRGIDPQIVNHFIKNGLLYQEKKTNNCVFVGYAPDGVARYAARKGTYTKNGEVFRGEVAGSKKMFSFSYTPNEDSFILRIQESPIEIMSHMSIDKMDGADWRNKHYISLGGLTYEPVYAYLRERPEIKVMEVCVNNDEAGHNMIQKYQERFGDQVEVVANMPDIIVTDKDGNPKGGDHNDLLLKKNCNQPAASRTITAYDFLQSERSV